MLEFLYTIRAVRDGMITEGPTNDEMAVLGEHESYLARLAEQGVVELAGRTQNSDPSTFGLVIFRAETEDEARLIMEHDPAVAAGLMRATLYPYRVAVRGTALQGFEGDDSRGK